MSTPITRLEAVLDVTAYPSTIKRADAFWAAVLGWPVSDPWPDHPEFVSFAPPLGAAYVHRQAVGSAAPTVHLDVEVEDLERTTGRLTALGAQPVRLTEDWQTLRSPGGLDFCLVRETTGVRPDPVTEPGGTRRRLVQVCLDVPAVHVEAELAFWRAALGWSEAARDSPEFLTRFVPPAGSPLQVLVQRLGEDDEGKGTRAHLDLGCDDIEAAADLVVELGGQRVLTGDGFVALRDPVGLVFCVTANSPDAP